LCDSLSKLSIPGSIDPGQLRLLLACVRAKEWVVYAKPPFGGPDQVLGYLANYTHRIAISNARILAFTGEHVTFRYRDAPGSHRNMTLSADEFLRRFLLHVIPKRLVRIRYYGFMANRTRASCLDRARRLIGHRPLPTISNPDVQDRTRCPRCHIGILRAVGIVERSPEPSFEDSS
jgi:hypothetical protein